MYILKIRGISHTSKELARVHIKIGRRNQIATFIHLSGIYIYFVQEQLCKSWTAHFKTHTKLVGKLICAWYKFKCIPKSPKRRRWRLRSSTLLFTGVQVAAFCERSIHCNNQCFRQIKTLVADHVEIKSIFNFSSSTCALTGFFWLLSHVIYLKLTKVL